MSKRLAQHKRRRSKEKRSSVEGTDTLSQEKRSKDKEVSVRGLAPETQVGVAQHSQY
ncbi:uncharacterized protein UHO2_07121 [Ustilago hordei]|uniref:Uncharacterized protein n=1 Tax=Ustilago hordei TaxID=120017 RepID=I2FNU0_USTHO|nr:uncharacterized protein UHO2_07121 [Ustilago hordei]CCF48583.1 uncharacterized protein UHOR_17007 [Ustilago hordei]SYW85168.1 uncharacterized protein UHO2_07121 [Ustilago hordei]